MFRCRPTTDTLVDVHKRLNLSEHGRPLAIITAILVIVVLVLWSQTWGTSDDTPGQEARQPLKIVSAPTRSPEPTAASAEPSPVGRCQAPTPGGFVPISYEIERLGSDEAVLSLGLASDGTIATAPLEEPRIASWWNQGPAAGSQAGKVVMSVHTYRKGDALGNELYSGGTSALLPGDRIIVRGSGDEVACYDFVEAKKIALVDYDPASDTMIDFDGDPLLTIIICWDPVPGTRDWDSRVFFYAEPYVGN